MTTKFQICPLFSETLARHKSKVTDALKQFILTKDKDPMAQFGAKDRHFSGEGNLQGYIHAGLTNDISLIYKRSGKNPTLIQMFAIMTHDELGTGQPANIKVQKSNNKRFGNQDFTDMPTKNT